jgi:hypothetical protein
MKNITNNLLYAALGGAVYVVGRFGIHQFEADYSAMPDWLFRIVIIATVSYAIIAIKRKNRGLLHIKEGTIAGIFTTFFLSLFLVVGTWFYCDLVNPNYTEGYKQEYREMHYNRMMRKYISETWKKDTVTQGAIDTINRGLDLNISKQTGTLFTTKGQMIISFLYTLFWGLTTAITVAMLSRQIATDPSPAKILDDKK